MTSLIACLSVGKGTWSIVHKLVMSKEWDSVFLVTTAEGKQKYPASKTVEFIIIDPEQDLKGLTAAIKERLSGRFSDLEVALNISSGTGKEHMAVISAILQSGLSFRLVDWSNGMIEV
jgi:mannitol-1-phosphate/altronate dehydrogenase